MTVLDREDIRGLRAPFRRPVGEVREVVIVRYRRDNPFDPPQRPSRTVDLLKDDSPTSSRHWTPAPPPEG
jgi:hypothetical protein